MKTHTYLPEDEVIRRALEVLMTALGPVETFRFLTLPRRRRLESVRRHRQWQASLFVGLTITFGMSRFSGSRKAGGVKPTRQS
jgi:hypothetical protein